MVRVFISSTFSDMQNERNILSRRVFPRLRVEASAAAALVEVDLRWGLTTAMTQDGGAVRLCLEGIDAAPCLLGMLGTRAGVHLDPDYVRQFDAGFARTVPSPCALTELEIRRGFANAARGAAATPRILVRRGSETRAAQAGLLAWLEHSHSTSLLRYDSDETFEAVAVEAMRQMLDEIPAGRMRVTDTVYVARDAVEDNVRHALRPKWFQRPRPCLVFAPAGAGQSTTLRAVLAGRRDISWCDGRLGWGPTAERTGGPASLSATIMQETEDGAKLIVCDHFEDGFATPERATLSSLPSLGTDSSRYVVATHLNRLADEALRLGWHVHKMAAPNREAAEEVAHAVLARFGKTLGPQEQDVLRAAPWLCNLSALVFALHELRRFGVKETLGTRLDELCAHRQTGALAADVVAQLDAALPAQWSGSVARIILSLATSLRGVEPWQAPRLAGPLALPPAYWCIVRETLASGLTERDGRIDVTSGPLIAWAGDIAHRDPQAYENAIQRLTALEQDLGEAALAHPVLIYRTGGPGALADLLSPPSTGARMAGTMPDYFEGCMDLLPARIQDAVAQNWAVRAAELNGEGPALWRLAIAAERIGALQSATELLDAITDPDGLSSEDLLIAAATIRASPSAQQELLALLAKPTELSPPLLTAGLRLFVDGAAMLSQRRLRTLSQTVDALSARSAFGAPSHAAEPQLLILIGQCHLLMARPSKAVPHFECAAAAARRTGQARALCLALERGATACLESGAFRQAEKMALECRDVARRSGLGRLESLAFARLTVIAARRARWTDAYTLNTAHRQRVSEAEIDDMSVPDTLLDGLESGTLR